MLVNKERQSLIEHYHRFSEQGNIKSAFENLAIAVFHYQYKYNEVYHQFCKILGINDKNVTSIAQIPFLPISVFKNQKVVSGNWEVEEVFLSSATTDMIRSRHYIRDTALYLQNAVRIWEDFYGPVEKYCFLALLPGYLEREGSSLVKMVSHFMDVSGHSQSGFFLKDYSALFQRLQYCKAEGIKTVLIGVSFALLDFVSKYQLVFPELIVIETGGMKGQHKEIGREVLHEHLKNAFYVADIHSEYGMTELLSQAYSNGNGLFYPGKAIKIFTRQINDPLAFEVDGKTGVIAAMDLCNIDSCAFILTDDLGVVYSDGSFNILGRIDNSDLRGCNLLIED